MGDLGIQASRPPVESYGDPGNRASAGNSAAECAEIDAEDGFPGWASEQDGGNAGSGTGVEDGFRKIGGSGGSFAARLAARTGGASPRLNTARFKAMPPTSLPIPRSPCLTIPPGLSPTTLLDSPVLLSNSLVEPSPTTGTFSLPPFLFESISACDSPSISSDASKNKGCEDGKSNFVFKPFAKSGNSTNLSPLGSSAAFGSTYEQAQPQSQPQSQSQSQCQSQSWTTTACAKEKQFLFDYPPERPVASTATDGPLNATPLQAIPSHVTLTQSASLEEKQQRQNSIIQAQTSEVDPNVLVPLAVAEKPSEDGYNWRKYGQKLVKGSEYPRSYYKCTHPNCQMKKKLERSHDGQITEIIYKGVHDHPKPQPGRRSAVGAAHGGHDEEERNDGFGAIGKIEDPLSRAQGQTSNHIESTGTPEFSSSDDDGEVGGKVLVEDPDEDETDSKRRKTENGSVDIVTASRTIREPRVVVQTTSEIDILDDGYRWRKYGQKVVKGNPNPRSYYKCTNAGCPVRKHVERASHDPKAVITTYEGKHNHDVPAPRNSNHDNTGTGNAQSSAAMQSNFAVPSNSITRSVSQVQDTLPQFDRHPEQMYMFERVADGNLNSQDRHAGILDLGVGGSMGFGKPGFDNSLRHNEKLQPTRITPSISAQLHNSMNLGMAGAGFPFQAFFGQAKERSMDLLRPKQETPENFSIEASAPPNHSSSSSIYHQSMGRLLLGP